MVLDYSICRIVCKAPGVFERRAAIPRQNGRRHSRFCGNDDPNFGNHFPLHYLEEIRHRDSAILSPIMDAWCRELKPQLFQPGAAGRQIGIGWLAVFEKHQLRNIAAHGMKDLASGTGSYFSFSRIPGDLTPRHARLLELLVPHMHIALVRALHNAKPARPRKTAASGPLTERELEVLRWLQAGGVPTYAAGFAVNLSRHWAEQK